MSESSAWERFEKVLELVVVRAMQIILMIMTVTATVVLGALVVRALRAGFGNIETTEDLHLTLQRGFGGVLVVLLGLELLDTLKTYFGVHRNRAQVILVVALIAVGRHIVQLDFDHAAGGLLFGLAALMLALTIGLFLVTKTRIESAASGPPSTARD